MQRRKFLIGFGALAAGSSAAIGTGAFEGAYVAGEREMNVSVAGDRAANLRLIDSSPFASYQAQGGGGVEDGADELVIDVDSLNPDADTRLDDVFRVRNATGSDVDLLILDGQESDENIGDYAEPAAEEDAFQIFADTDGGGGVGTRIDTGATVSLGPGEVASINLIAFLKENDPSSLPSEMLVVADGTS